MDFTRCEVVAVVLSQAIPVKRTRRVTTVFVKHAKTILSIGVTLLSIGVTLIGC
jgi:hypothetical protein